MAEKLGNIKVAILVTDGFEEVELTEPRKALDRAGAETHIVSPKEGHLDSWEHNHWGDPFDVDVKLKDAVPEEYDAVLLPGGVLNPDQLRTIDRAVRFVEYFLDHDKPVAAICHGPQLLIETYQLKGRKMTSYHSIKTDLINAGASWVNEEVVVDKNLITSRKPDDIGAFNEALIKELGKRAKNN